MRSLVPQGLGLIGAGAPLATASLLGGVSLFYRPLPERAAGALLRGTFVLSFACLCAASVALSWADPPRASLSLGRWFAAGGYTFEPKLLLDRLSLRFATFTTALSGVTAAFALRYLHREPGFNRFFVQLTLFASGANLVVLAGDLETAFAGWWCPRPPRSSSPPSSRWRS